MFSQLVGKFFEEEQAKGRSLIECDICESKFVLDIDKLEETIMESKEDDVWVKVTWFRCSSCKEVYLVSVETKHMINYKNYVLKQIEKAYKKSKKTENAITKSKMKKLNKMRSKLEVTYFKAKIELGPVVKAAIMDSLSFTNGDVK